MSEDVKISLSNQKKSKSDPNCISSTSVFEVSGGGEGNPSVINKEQLRK